MSDVVLLQLLAALFTTELLGQLKSRLARAAEVSFARQELTLPTDAPQVYWATPVDVNGDTYTDIVTSSWVDAAVIWYPNNGEGVFKPGEILTHSLGGANTVWGADVDNDGDMDLVASGGGDDGINGGVIFLKNIGTGSFADPVTVSTEEANYVHAGDLDGDGVPDILVSFKSNEVVWFSYDSTEGVKDPFSPFSVTNDVDGPISARAVDMDNDAFLDVLICSSDDNRVMWLKNNGTGAFLSDPQIVGDAEGEPFFALEADINGDGLQDVVVPYREANKVLWYNNTGSGAFEAVVIDPLAMNTKAVFVADLDGDLDLEVLAAQEEGSAPLVWYENMGLRHFDNPKLIDDIESPVPEPRSVHAADYDGDPYPDIVVSFHKVDRLIYYKTQVEPEPTEGPTALPTILTAPPPRTNVLESPSSDPISSSMVIFSVMGFVGVALVVMIGMWAARRKRAKKKKVAAATTVERVEELRGADPGGTTSDPPYRYPPGHVAMVLNVEELLGTGPGGSTSDPPYRYPSGHVAMVHDVGEEVHRPPIPSY